MAQQILTADSSKRLVLQSGQALRQPVYGSSWTKIRIGLRLCFPAAASLTGSPQLVIGMCNGTAANAFADASTTNFCGVRTIVSGSWTFAGTPAVNGYFGPLQYGVCKRVATTLTDQGSNIDSGVPNYMSATSAIRSVVILQIEKGSPNYTFRMVLPGATTAAQTDVTDAQFLAFMELDAALTSPSSIVANYARAQANNTLAMSEVAGGLDTINIYWDKTSVPIYIDDVDHRLIA